MLKARLTVVAVGMFLVVGVGFAENIKKREKRQDGYLLDSGIGK